MVRLAVQQNGGFGGYLKQREDKQALSRLNFTIQNIQYKDGRCSLGFLSNGQQTNLQNNQSAALIQLKSPETSLGKDQNLKERSSGTIESDLEKGCVSKLETSNNISKNLCWYLFYHLVLNPNNSKEVRRVCNAASKFRGTSFTDVLLIGSDLLRSVCVIIFGFWGKPVTLSGDIVEMFLQVEAEVHDRKYRLLLWRKDDGQFQFLW